MNVRIYPVYLIAILFGLAACESECTDDMVITAGKALYEAHCAACHSIEGQGSIFKDYPSLKGTQLETLDIVHRVTGSEPQERKMPTFDNLSEAEAELIARYIKTL